MKNIDPIVLIIANTIDEHLKLIELLDKGEISVESITNLNKVYMCVQDVSERLDNLNIEIKNNKIPVLGQNLLFIINKIIELIQQNDIEQAVWRIQCELVPCYKIWQYLINYFYIDCTDEEGIKEYWEKERKHLNNLFRTPKIDPDITYPYELSIIVLFYNKIEDTKQCIESIIEYTKDINYELITLNNGSDEEATAWSESLPHKKKLHLKYNIGSSIGSVFAMFPGITEGKYCIYLSNDLVLTKDYAKNLLECIKSDPAIGMATPTCNSLINRQAIEVNYKTMEEMQKFAADFNKSNPGKWEERARLLPYAGIYRPEAIKNIGFIYDPIFFKCDVYADDDFSQKLKHAGYKLIHCADTFIHHNQLATHGGNDNERQTEGRKGIYNKFGLDIYFTQEDRVFYSQILPDFQKNQVKILVIDSVYGHEALAVKASLKLKNISSHLTAFVTDKGRITDMRAVMDEVVFRQNISDISLFTNKKFDIIIVSPDIGDYTRVFDLMKDLYNLLERKGIVMMSFMNPSSADFIYLTSLLMLPFCGSIDKNRKIRKGVINYDYLIEMLHEIGFTTVHTYYSRDYLLDSFPDSMNTLKSLVPWESQGKLEGKVKIKEYFIKAGVN